MFSLIGRIIVGIFVVIGVAAPIGGCWLLFTRKPQVDFYLGHVFGENHFSKLPDSHRQLALQELDRALERRAAIGMTANPIVVIPPADSDAPAPKPNAANGEGK